ncbi:MAG: Na+/H+ antiporter NhaC family protein [Bacteroidales bacterium]|nr:Na+/H+ antiporter NhaC family protein [Bacteroidales bacterium]
MKHPSLLVSLLPIAMLIALLSVSIYMFGDGMLAGPSQVVLILITGVICAIAIVGYKKKWSFLEDFMIGNIGSSMPACLILFMVGAICATWMQSGIIPTMIYYGLNVISARWFLLTACAICSLVSLCIGSSWTTIATVGVGLMGIGHTLGISDGWVAGAIISGAYFGDKISPLSETTNLASSMAGVPLFDHIRNMMKTTVPSISVTMVVFIIVGLLSSPSAEATMDATQQMQSHLLDTFTISPLLFIVPLGVFYLIYKGLPAIIVLFLGALVAAVMMPFVQPQLVEAIVGAGKSGFTGGLECVMRVVFGGVSYETGNVGLNDLVSTSGMSGMLSTIWLIICSMCFGGAMEASGMLGTITESLLKMMRGRFKTVATTCLSCLFVNVAAGDQYLAIILPAKMYGEAFGKQNLEKKLLSRTVEDSGTVTSVLIPWNSCGMTQSTVLGVSTLVYAPFAIFCWLSPITTMLFAAFHSTRKSVSGTPLVNNR